MENHRGTAPQYRYHIGISFTILLYLSSLFGAIFMLTPFLPLLFIHPPMFRKIVDVLLGFWKLYAVSLLEILAGIKMKFTGNFGHCTEGSLILLNHRTRLDWFYLFCYELRYGSLTRGKIILKQELKNIPGPGWAMQSALFIFLIRKWEQDRPNLSKILAYFKKLSYKPQILIFPEGTDFSEYSKERSDAFAKKNNLPLYDYVLHPRTTGFVFLAQEMHNAGILDSVVDITVGYPLNIPRNELDVFRGNFPKEIHFHANRHSVNKLPKMSEGLTEWCQDLWKDKEEQLRQYYQEKSFPEVANHTMAPDVRIWLYFALIFWTVFILSVMWGLYVSMFIRWFSFLSCVTFTIIGLFYNGVDTLQLNVPFDV